MELAVDAFKKYEVTVHSPNSGRNIVVFPSGGGKDAVVLPDKAQAQVFLDVLPGVAVPTKPDSDKPRTAHILDQSYDARISSEVTGHVLSGLEWLALMESDEALDKPMTSDMGRGHESELDCSQCKSYRLKRNTPNGNADESFPDHSTVDWETDHQSHELVAAKISKTVGVNRVISQEYASDDDNDDCEPEL